jgi:FSR family fosmidomycin resistance protein-like MFS transporter
MTMGLAFGLGGLGTSVTGILADHWGVAAALLMTALLLLPAIVLVYLLKKPQILLNEAVMKGVSQ